MKTEKKYIVYKHTSPSNKVYIGITRQEPSKRWENGRGYRECPAFWCAIQKYGWENINHEILCEGLSKEEAETEEIRLIKFFRITDARYGYNIENGGNCFGTHSEETKKKISAGNKGKTFSAESIAKMRAAHKGKQLGADNSFYGRHHTEETKQLISERMKGNQWNKGNHHTEEYKRAKSEQMRRLYANGGNPRCKRVFYIENGIRREFLSMREAAKQLGVGITTIFNFVHNAANVNWGFCNEERA